MVADIKRFVRMDRYHSAALETEVQIATGQVRLHSIRGILGDATVVTDRFVQIFDRATALAGGEEPVWEVLIPGATTGATQYAEAGDDFLASAGLLLATGLRVALSTTPRIFTTPGQPEAVFMATFEGP